jgi:hypothetical protein
MLNKDRKYCYRITHIQNLPLILENGIVNKNHRDADGNYIEIGNPEIIDVRSTTPVRIDGYGMIGDYVPFYFTPKSMMLFNIITGYRAPVVPKRRQNEILVIRCLITDLTKLTKWFFTDGQANIKDGSVKHYNNLSYLHEIDWESIQQSNFSKNDGDYDRPRRYQAEFLVNSKVPLKFIESLNVYNQNAADYVNEVLNENNINLAVNIQPQYFF